jgi:predicted peroxiredoxin
MRQGDPEASKWLDQARDMALPTGELQRTGPVATARAEAAWWAGDRMRVLEEVSGIYEQASQARDAWQLGPIVFWIWRAGGEILPIDHEVIRDRIPLCYLAMIEGDARTAAAEWERIGCPNVAASADQEVVLLLTIDGVWNATKGYADDICREGFQPLRDVMQSFIANGGQIWTCGACAKPRGITEADLIPGARIVSAANAVEYLASGGVSLSF